MSVDQESSATPPSFSSSAAAPVRVLHLINGEHYSGAERVQDLLALRLGAEGFEVGFACLKPDRFAAMRQSQTPLFNTAMNGRFDLSPVGDVIRLVRRERFALIHTHTPRAAVIGRLAAAMAGVPMVHHVHSPTTKDSTRRWQNRFNALLESSAMTRVAAAIAVSESLGRYARSLGVPARRVTVVPNGVPVIGPLAKRRPPSGKWTLGMVALFRPRKGLEVLLDAMAILRAEGCEVSLRAVGPFETPEYRAKILEQVDRLHLGDAIEWVGFTRDVLAELRKFDLLVLPSLFGEGLPMVILEAMAAGVPVVSTRVEGVPDAIRDGIDGVLALPGDPFDLARSINRVVKGDIDWSFLRQVAHERQATRFSDVSMAAGVAGVYRRVLGATAPLAQPVAVAAGAMS